MKSLVRRVLFSVLVAVPMTACGGGDGEVVVTPPPSGEGSSVMPGGASGDSTVAPNPVAPQVVSPEIPVATPTTYVDALALGKQLADQGHGSRAREMFELAIKLDKQQVEPHIELARLFIANGDRALAIRSANKAVKMAPESSQAYNTLGRAELARFNYDNAIVAFRQATELNADNVWAWNNLGYTYLQLKRYQDAADALAEATSRKGTTGYMWNNLGTAYEHLDQLDDARDAFEQGGALGSVEALASRKRLEGVETIAIFKPVGEPESEKVYDTREEMPEVPEAPEVPLADPESGGFDDPVVPEGEVHDDVRAEEPVQPT